MQVFSTTRPPSGLSRKAPNRPEIGKTGIHSNDTNSGNHQDPLPGQKEEVLTMALVLRNPTPDPLPRPCHPAHDMLLVLQFQYDVIETKPGNTPFQVFECRPPSIAVRQEDVPGSSLLEKLFKRAGGNVPPIVAPPELLKTLGSTLSLASALRRAAPTTAGLSFKQIVFHRW